MRTLLLKEMKAGALGLSSGLEYDPGIYSDSTELFDLAAPLKALGGRYISHIRSKDRRYWAAVAELIAIGRHAGIPVQESHTKLAMKAIWGEHDSLLAMLNGARAAKINVTADVYPYTYWQSGLTVLFPGRDFENRASAAFAPAASAATSSSTRVRSPSTSTVQAVAGNARSFSTPSPSMRAAPSYPDASLW